MLFVADSAKDRILEILGSENKSLEHYFVRISVTSGGCSGLSYKLDFDNDLKPTDQVFEDKGIRLVTDLRSFLYVHNTILEFSGGLRAKGFNSPIRMHRELAPVERAFRFNFSSRGINIGSILEINSFQFG